MIQPLHVWGAHSGGLDSRPRDGKAIALQIEPFGERDVLWVKVVLVAGNVAGHTSASPSRCVCESIPDRLTFTILVPCTFILIRGGGDTPKESFGETGLLNHGVGNGAGGWGSGALHRCVAAALGKRSTCNSGQGTGSKLT